MEKVSKLYQHIEPLIEKGETTRAVEAMEAFLCDHGDVAKVYHDLGALYLGLGEKTKAEANFINAAEREPENNSYLRVLGDFYYVEMQNAEKALACYRKLIANGMKTANIFFIAGNLSLVAHRFDDAIRYYENVLALEPWHMEAFDFLEKVKARVNPLQQQPVENSAEAWLEKALDAGAEGKDELAVSYLEKAIEMEPEHATAHNDMAVYLYRLGEEKRSLDHYRIATQLEPQNVTFRKNLADFLCFVKGDLADALNLYRQLLQEDPDDVEVLMAVGHVNQAMGRVTDSKLFYERVLDLEPWNYSAGEMLAGINAPGSESTDARA